MNKRIKMLDVNIQRGQNILPKYITSYLMTMTFCPFAVVWSILRATVHLAVQEWLSVHDLDTWRLL